jgi:cell division protein FtsW
MRFLATVDRKFIWLVFGITAFGLIVLMSASGPLGYQKFGDSFYFLKHQLLYGLLPGSIAFLIFSSLNYKTLRHLAFPSLILSIILLVAVYLPGMGVHIGGSSRWITLGPIRFQPSEFVKISFLLYLAAWLSSRQENDAKTVERGLVPFLCSLGVVMFLLIQQPNTGSMMVIAGSSLFVYFVAGAPLMWFLGLGAAGVGMVALLIKLTPYRAARFMTFLHPELDPQGVGYHINQAFLAIGSGGLFGLGYGHSRQKFLYLPEVAGDSIFAIMAEEMGFIAVVLFICVIGALVWRCFKIASRTTDPFGMYLAVGIGSWIALQSFFNIASMCGLLPITGVTLPFVSYGSSALIALLMAAGIVVSISRVSKSNL